MFWQVHVGAAEALAAAVRAALGAEPGDYVVDLYAGAGLFSVLLADDVGPRRFGAGGRARSPGLCRRRVQRPRIAPSCG